MPTLVVCRSETLPFIKNRVCRSYKFCGPYPLGHHSLGFCRTRPLRLISWALFGFRDTFFDTVLPSISICKTPDTVFGVGFFSSADNFIIAGCWGPSTWRTPGTWVITWVSVMRTFPVFRMITLSHIPVFLSRMGCIQSHPAVYCKPTFRAIVPSPPWPPFGLPGTSGGRTSTANRLLPFLLRYDVTL